MRLRVHGRSVVVLAHPRARLLVDAGERGRVEPEAREDMREEAELEEHRRNAQKGEVDFEKRKAIVHEFEKKALEQAYVLPVTYTDRVVSLHKSVKGYVIANSHILNNTFRGIYLED